MNRIVEGEISSPGRNPRLVLPSRLGAPYFADKAKVEERLGQQLDWRLRVQLPGGKIQEYGPEVDWEVVSKFGRIVSTGIKSEAGDYTKPRVDEAPNVNLVVWGRDPETQELKLAVISQARPHADHYDQTRTDDVVFASVPMGFKDRLLGKDNVTEFESTAVAGAREANEEAGTPLIKSIAEPAYPYNYPNPTFIGTWSDLAFVEVDLKRWEKDRTDRTEDIYKVNFVTVPELLQAVVAGESDLGLARMATSNSALLIFLASQPEFQQATQNYQRVKTEAELRRKFKEVDPKGYRRNRERVMKALDPERYKEYRKRVQRKKWKMFNTDLKMVVKDILSH